MSTTTWRYWSSTTSSSTTTDYTWYYWSEATDSSTTGASATVDGYNTDTRITWTTWCSVDRVTDQQTVNLQFQNNEHDAQKAKEAELTAQELLKDLISEEEMETYLKTGRILVKGKTHDYILEKGYQARVLKVAKGKIISLSDRKKIKGRSLCVHPVNQSILPDTDKIISMKLSIEAEEKRVLDLANDHGERELDLASNG